MNNLTNNEIQTIIQFLNRVNIQGNEALTLLQVMQKLNQLLQAQQKPVEKPVKEDKK